MSAVTLDKSKIKPIPIQKTLILINNFIVNTVDFFNTFSETVEKKVSKLSNKVTELETLLAVLEAKLNSIPGLDYAAPSAEPSGATPAAEPGATAAAISSSTPNTTSAPTAAAPPPPPPPPAPGGTSSTALTVANPPTETGAGTESTELVVHDEGAPAPSGMARACDHPDYLPFFKLLKVGVPPFVVQAKVSAAGLDPNMIEAPDTLINA